jgi:hypothetical protein
MSTCNQLLGSDENINNLRCYEQVCAKNPLHAKNRCTVQRHLNFTVEAEHYSRFVPLYVLVTNKIRACQIFGKESTSKVCLLKKTQPTTDINYSFFFLNVSISPLS